jgi:hypothetical protein
MGNFCIAKMGSSSKLLSKLQLFVLNFGCYNYHLKMFILYCCQFGFEVVDG